MEIKIRALYQSGLYLPIRQQSPFARFFSILASLRPDSYSLDFFRLTAPDEFLPVDRLVATFFFATFFAAFLVVFAAAGFVVDFVVFLAARVAFVAAFFVTFVATFFVAFFAARVALPAAVLAVFRAVATFVVLDVAVADVDDLDCFLVGVFFSCTEGPVAATGFLVVFLLVLVFFSTGGSSAGVRVGAVKPANCV